MTANDLFVPPEWDEQPHNRGERLAAAVVATVYLILVVVLPFLL